MGLVFVVGLVNIIVNFCLGFCIGYLGASLDVPETMILVVANLLGTVVSFGIASILYGQMIQYPDGRVIGIGKGFLVQLVVLVICVVIIVIFYIPIIIVSQMM